jgi:hypothetical protein
MESQESESESSQERRRIESMMQGFNSETSPAIRALVKRYGREMTLVRLRGEAEHLVTQFQGALTPLERVHKRRKSVLLKWFDDNWSVIELAESRPPTQGGLVHEEPHFDDVFEWAYTESDPTIEH